MSKLRERLQEVVQDTGQDPFAWLVNGRLCYLSHWTPGSILRNAEGQVTLLVAWLYFVPALRVPGEPTFIGPYLLVWRDSKFHLADELRPVSEIARKLLYDKIAQFLGFRYQEPEPLRAGGDVDEWEKTHYIKE